MPEQQEMVSKRLVAELLRLLEERRILDHLVGDGYTGGDLEAFYDDLYYVDDRIQELKEQLGL